MQRYFIRSDDQLYTLALASTSTSTKVISTSLTTNTLTTMTTSNYTTGQQENLKFDFKQNFHSNDILLFEKIYTICWIILALLILLLIVLIVCFKENIKIGLKNVLSLIEFDHLLKKFGSFKCAEKIETDSSKSVSSISANENENAHSSISLN